MIHQLNTTIITALLIVECYNVKHLEGRVGGVQLVCADVVQLQHCLASKMSWDKDKDNPIFISLEFWYSHESVLWTLFFQILSWQNETENSWSRMLMACAHSYYHVLPLHLFSVHFLIFIYAYIKHFTLLLFCSIYLTSCIFTQIVLINLVYGNCLH